MHSRPQQSHPDIQGTALSTFRQTIPSPLKWQSRTVACFPDGSGFAVGSIEGRVALQYVDDKSQHLNFAFKCHRDGNNIYSINSISFHPVYGTFSTAGSDGYLHFWDKDSRQRLESSASLGTPISSTCFNRNGSIFAYSLSYDWSKVRLAHLHRDTSTTIDPTKTPF